MVISNTMPNFEVNVLVVGEERACIGLSSMSGLQLHDPLGRDAPRDED